ncbi:hypothetical protein Tco_0775371 [Tanacetum coccineum]
MKSIQTFLKKFNRISFGETPKILLLALEKFFEIQHAKPEDIQDLLYKILEDLKIISEEFAEFINSPSWNRPTFYDVDDDEYTIIYRPSKAITPDLSIKEPDNSLRYQEQEVKNIAKPAAKRQTRITSCLQNFKVISKESTIPLNKTPQISLVNAITHDLPTEEPEYSLIMGNEELSTIPEKESDKFIKSSVEDLIPILRESEDTSGSDSKSVLPLSNDFSPIFEEKSMTFFNPLFDSNDFTSGDNELLSDEDVPEDVKIYSNPLFEFNEEYISSDVNPLFDKVLENIESKDSYVSNLDETALLVTPLSFHFLDD